MKNQNTHYQRAKIIGTTKLLFTLMALLAMQLPARAQTRFTRSTFNAAYTPISIGGGATSSSATGDNAEQTGIALGFSFNYADSTFTSVGINTNCLLWFDAVTPTGSAGYNNQYLVTTSGSDQNITPWWINTMDDASSDILYQTQGAPGSRTFTVQYSNYPTYAAAPAGTNVRMNCQVILYETTNVIELRYGSLNVIGAATTSAAAMIGIEWGAGGSGNFIDAVTGSSIVNNRMLSPQSGWPKYNFRFTPGIPTPIAAGTYNVGVGQTYNSLTQAVADVNHRGIDGAVTLNLTDAQYDTTVANGSNIFPILVATPNGSATNLLTISKTGTAATVAYRGSSISVGAIGTGVSSTAISDASEPLLGVCASYTTISNLNLISHGAPQTVEIGLAIFELFVTKGAHYNTFDKISIDLDRTHGGVYGIASFSTNSNGGVAGTNSYNTWQDITIKDCNVGFSLAGVNNASGPGDIGNRIITSSCNTYNYIGDPNTPDDILNGSSYGILVAGQNGFIVRNCIIQNITGTSTTADVTGILVTNSHGSNEISNNIIHTLRRSNAAVSSSRWVSGIRIDWDNQTMGFKIFNNSISNLLSSYAGAPTSNTGAVGIYFQDTGAGTVTSEIYNNSISMDGSTYPNASTFCFLNVSITKTFQIKNNVFANFTGPQTGAAYHTCVYTNAANYYGNAASLSDYNVYYLADTTRGFLAQATTNYFKTLAQWQAAMTSNPGTDANSLVGNPNFVNNATDLHSTAATLDGTGTTPPAFITTDLDCKLRTSPNDIGCYNIGCEADGGTITPATATVCAKQIYTMSSTGFNVYPGVSYQWMRATTPGGPYSNVSGGSGATSATYTTGKLTTGTYYYVMKATCPSGSFDYSTELTIIVKSIPTATITAAGDTTFCSGGSVELNAATQANRSYQWKKGSNVIAAATSASYTATGSATYTVVVTNTSNGCTKSSNGIKVTSNLLPSATITPSGSLTFCAGDSVVLQANTGVDLIYKWKKGANYISGATASAYTAKAGGTYKVEVTDSNGCSKLSGGKLVAINCRVDGSALSDYDVTIFPNPAQDILNITCNNEDDFEIEIENMLGEVILKTKNQNAIDISKLIGGVYFIKVFNANHSVTQKLIKL